MSMTDSEKIEALKSLVIFLAETWSEIDEFVYEHCDGDDLCKYPVIQGTRNQIDLRNIGRLGIGDIKKIRTAVNFMLGLEE